VPTPLTLILFFVKAYLRNVICSTNCSVFETGICVNKEIEGMVKKTPCKCVFGNYPFKEPIGLRLS